ncbi:MAG: cobalamin biosynthesis protein CobD [Bradyrhizobium sp.]|uniref:adenosylcobinamide-phosphate synthase CbiB n=1 Tax=Bradyrhizobium sp. TaxID=376 RepID=UPI001C2A2458|nr:adenosylcobinamide-phosphate synthase CbiB [Bradyrhizobium sp.]MBU6461995.1 cobalamin biosynthesis protein CobD [Pseudomonadota bacterium]MDE2066092.1 cobalamin biosynthesis protein CobD [Bradyrhizobium sp.]MDE2240980.1 cobalamin biosynthesis protein CobD [Bradyrhizobium sp.]MDE2469932.1 cobalamin biosynthesis protein CobD [Bradyrhizobium sp.]
MFVPPSRTLILIVAFGIEAVLAYPASLFRAIGHPVSWIGSLISALESRLNWPDYSDVMRRATGIVTVLVLVMVSLVAGLALDIVTRVPVLGFVIAVVVVAALVAAGSLDKHVRAVATALRTEGLVGGRQSIAKIVGRDPHALDQAAICRAAIESLAENASDGVTAPAFWFLLGGLPGMIAYKAINTADSMIGHLSDRYRAFGWAAARLDDLVNWPASRLTGLIFITAAWVVPGASAAAAWEAFRRDARLHRSPNAGWPEAAMAGALGLRLAGPRVYDGKSVDDHWMGDGRAEATVDDIGRALTIYRVAIAGALFVVAIIGWLINALD